jgi:hypothetical protein
MTGVAGRSRARRHRSVCRKGASQHLTESTGNRRFIHSCLLRRMPIGNLRSLGGFRGRRPRTRHDRFFTRDQLPVALDTQGMWYERIQPLGCRDRCTPAESTNSPCSAFMWPVRRNTRLLEPIIMDDTPGENSSVEDTHVQPRGKNNDWRANYTRTLTMD